MPEFADPDISLDAAGREEESLFARDENDVLIRREKETRDRFSQFVEIVIDGYAVKVKGLKPSKGTLNLDSFGHGFRTIWFG